MLWQGDSEFLWRSQILNPDLNGDGVVDCIQTITTSLDGARHKTELLSDYNGVMAVRSRADTTPTFTAADGVDKLPQLPGSGSIYSIAYKASNDNDFNLSILIPRASAS